MRQLTNKEKKTIKGYNLSPQVEQKVWDVWGQDDKPAKLSLIVRFVIVIVVFGSSVVLLTNYFAPDMAHMQGLLNMIRFFFWTMLPLTVIVMAVKTLKIGNDENKAFKKYALYIWYQKRNLFSKIRKLNQFALVIGLVLNGYFVSALMIIVCIFAVFFIKTEIRSAVQKIMNKIVPLQNDDITEAEYKLIK